MSSINSVKALSAEMSLTLQQATKQLMADVQQGVDSLDRKKESIARAGLQRLQESNQTAAVFSQNRSKIDVYA